MDCPEIWYKYSCPPEAELLKLFILCVYMVFILLPVVVLSIILLCLLIDQSIIAVSCCEFPSEGSIKSCLIFGDCLTSYLAQVGQICNKYLQS